MYEKIVFLFNAGFDVISVTTVFFWGGVGGGCDCMQ